MKTATRLTYRTPVAPPISTALLSLAILAGLFGLMASLMQGGPWAFMVLWLIVTAGVAFGLLFLTCHEVVIQDGLLEWRTAFRRGKMRMDQAERVVGWPGGSIQVFEFREGKKVRIAVMQGYIRFIEQVHQTYPQLPLPPTAYARFVEHMRAGATDRDDGGPGNPSPS
jgi:hypothetical protein